MRRRRGAGSSQRSVYKRVFLHVHMYEYTEVCHHTGQYTEEGGGSSSQQLRMTFFILVSIHVGNFRLAPIEKGWYSYLSAHLEGEGGVPGGSQFRG